MIPPLRPLVASTFALLLGLVPALRHPLPPLPLLALALAALALSLRLPPRPRVASPAPVLDLPLLVAFVCAGALLGVAGARDAADDCRNWIDDGASVRVRGRLGAASTAAEGEGGAPLLPLEAGEVVVGARSCPGAVRVRLPPAELPAGAGIDGAGHWVRSSPPAVPSGWPGEPLYRGFVAVDTLLATTGSDPIRHPLLHARGRAEARLARLFPGHFGLAEALVLGRRERMDPEVRDRFARAGLVHLLAISGAHVALLAAMLLLAGNVLHFGREGVRIGAIAMTAAYLAVIGAPGSAVRAGIMLSLALLARILHRPAATLPIIAAAALLLVAWSPRAVLDPGVQLSFAGVGALMVAGRVPYRKLPRPLRRGPPKGVLEALVVSALAFLLTAPITAHHFGAISPVAILANLPAVPLTSLALVGVVSALVADPFVPPLARILADGAALALDAVGEIARIAADAPYGHVRVARPPWAMWLALGAVAALAVHALPRASRPARGGIAAGLALSVWLAWPALASRAGGALEIHFIDVGQGDAIALRTPADRWVLIDVGLRSESFDAGERRVLPFLSAHGARRVEALVLTHPHSDHIGGAAAVLEGVEVGRLVEPGLPVGSGMYLELLELAERRGVPWSRAESGRTLRIDGVELRFLWPDASALPRITEANDASAVVLLRYGDFAALLTGDAPDEVERELVARERERLWAQILKAGHHGSATSTSPELLAAVRPELFVISAGRRNRYGHPSPEVVERVEGAGIEIARTDREGTLSFRVRAIDGYRWSRITP